MKSVRLICPALLALLTTLTVIACNGGSTGSAGGAIKVGSKDFTEQFILGKCMLWC